MKELSGTTGSRGGPDSRGATKVEEASEQATAQEQDGGGGEGGGGGGERIEDIKALGNQCFGAQDYRGAVAAYSRALALVPGEPTILSNRSAALLSIGRTGASQFTPQFPCFTSAKKVQMLTQQARRSGGAQRRRGGGAHRADVGEGVLAQGRREPGIGRLLQRDISLSRGPQDRAHKHLDAAGV
jgi:hypothetical protein